MRIANVAGRLTLVTELDDEGVPVAGLDVEAGSGGWFDADPQAVYGRWDEFVDWARAPEANGAVPIARTDLGPPVPAPGQVFAIGLNYRDHADETVGAAPVTCPSTFTKFPTCLTGAFSTVELPPGTVDWEVELVAVLGRAAYRTGRDRAWAHVAGVTIGQDLSERSLQMTPPLPQFSLAKSFPGFGPMGPALVTPDELVDPDDLALSCAIDGETVQDGRTEQMIYDVPDIVAWLSSVTRLLPGDVIFTGTPAGVGMGMDPPRYLRPGEMLISRIEHLGEMRTTLVAAGHLDKERID